MKPKQISNSPFMLLDVPIKYYEPISQNLGNTEKKLNENNQIDILNSVQEDQDDKIAQINISPENDQNVLENDAITFIHKNIKPDEIPRKAVKEIKKLISKFPENKKSIFIIPKVLQEDSISTDFLQTDDISTTTIKPVTAEEKLNLLQSHFIKNKKNILPEKIKSTVYKYVYKPKPRTELNPENVKEIVDEKYGDTVQTLKTDEQPSESYTSEVEHEQDSPLDLSIKQEPDRRNILDSSPESTFVKSEHLKNNEALTNHLDNIIKKIKKLSVDLKLCPCGKDIFLEFFENGSNC